MAYKPEYILEILDIKPPRKQTAEIYKQDNGHFVVIKPNGMTLCDGYETLLHTLGLKPTERPILESIFENTEAVTMEFEETPNNDTHST